MKALIIGGGGFVGKYLAEHLMQDRGWETVVTKKQFLWTAVRSITWISWIRMQ